MKLKLLLLMALFVSFTMAAETGLRGIVIDAKTSQPVAGATVMLDHQGVTATTGPNGDFLLTGANAGRDKLLIFTYGYKDMIQDVELYDNAIGDAGRLLLTSTISEASVESAEESKEMILSEEQLEDEEGNTQNVAALTSASDDPFTQAASFGWTASRFRERGYESEYNQGFINGLSFNDAARGRFNYSITGGLNNAFRNRSTSHGLAPASFTLGDVGGASNVNTEAKDYAPGFRASVAYTNSNYKWRGIVLYSTGLRSNGWAMTLGAIGRYAGEGIVPGSFYNSWGYFLALEKVFNSRHRLALTTFGAPTKRANNSATFVEAYQLAGNYLYNTNWGWQEGKKRSARVTETFDPTVILNWIWTPKMGTELNTAIGFHKSFYSTSALNWYNSADPRPDYYRYLPSYYRASDPTVADELEYLWRTDESKRQINWDEIYQVNYLNNYMSEKTGVEKGSSYILEKRHSNQFNWLFNTNLNMRLNKILTLQGGLNANYSRSSYYKTLKDLLGGRYWSDVDQYAERDFPGDAEMLQNDLDNPNRAIYVGDRFGYDYNINSFAANLWAQNVFNTAHWDFNYGASVSYTQFQRDGHMRNGRAPENSKGKGVSHDFVNFSLKGGFIYKLDGRNNFAGHLFFGTKAPQYYNAYISPRIKDDVIDNLKSATILSGDLSYIWNYRRFRGSITGFWTEFWDMTERTSFYDDLNSTFINYAMTGVKKEHKGVEIGASYKLTANLTVKAAANFARYQYKNRPTGVRSFENGSQADVTRTVYLKNYYVAGTPQEAYLLGFNWQGPKSWFVEVSGTYTNRAYIQLSPVRHEVLADLYQFADSEQDLQEKMKALGDQEKLNEAFLVNLSIGKFIRLSRKVSLNLNLNINNLFNNMQVQTGGYQQGRFDTKDYTNTTTKFPNKYYYAQGIRIFFNAGIRF